MAVLENQSEIHTEELAVEIKGITKKYGNLLAGFIMPTTIGEWSVFAVTIAFTALFSSSLGILLANAIKKQDIIVGTTINLSFLLFFLSGGLVPIPNLPS